MGSACVKRQKRVGSHASPATASPVNVSPAAVSPVNGSPAAVSPIVVSFVSDAVGPVDIVTAGPSSSNPGTKLIECHVTVH